MQQLIITGKKAPLFVRAMFILLFTITFLIPVIVTLLVVESKQGFHFGIMLSYVLCWIVAFYLLRIILWNSYGKEIITVDNDKITYIADFKYFKDGKREIVNKEVDIEIIHDNTPDLRFVRFKLFNETGKIETVLQTELNEFEEIKDKIKFKTKIYVLKIDGTDVWVPVNARQLSSHNYELLSDNEYEELEDSELFQFYPGDVVSVVKHEFSDGSVGLVAKELIHRASIPDRDYLDFKFYSTRMEIPLNKATANKYRPIIERIRKESADGKFFYPNILNTIDKLNLFGK